MSTNEKFIELIDLISKKSEERKITWQTSLEFQTYMASLPNSFVVVVGKDSSGYFVRLCNSAGNLLDITSGVSCMNLYQIARRQALNVDEKLDQILKSLAEMGS